MWRSGEQSVVVAFAVTEAIAKAVEGHTGDDCYRNFRISFGREHLTGGLQNAIGANGHVAQAAVKAQVHMLAINHSRQQNRFSAGSELRDQVVGEYFALHAMIKKNGIGGFYPWMKANILNNWQRLGHEFFVAEKASAAFYLASQKAFGTIDVAIIHR